MVTRIVLDPKRLGFRYFKDKMLLYVSQGEWLPVLDEDSCCASCRVIKVPNFDDDEDDTDTRNICTQCGSYFELINADAFDMMLMRLPPTGPCSKFNTAPSTNGHVLVMSNHARPVMHDSEDTRDMAEITRKRMMEKMQSPLSKIEKVKQHYKEMFESIKITRTSTNEKTSSLLTQIEDLKAQLEGNLKVATSDSVKPKVLAPGMYAIDVKPIPHPLKNNRSAHLTYINHLKESVETVREIVEEARVVKPLDNALNYACQYTKLSQELLEYVIGTCPKSFNERDNKAPSTPVTRKKQVTFNDKPGTSFRVNTSTEASGSKPRSNTKKNRILPAKTENKKKVEDHPWTKVNRVDSSISSKRVVINSNSKFVEAGSGNQKGKQMSDNSLNKTKQVWKATGKLFANVGYQWRSTGKKVALGKLNCGYQWRPTGKKFSLGELCPLTKLSVQCRTGHPLVFGLRLFKTYNEESFKAQELCGKVHRVSQIRE
ncbi:hypothetical protein Tco_0808425 [Tanacetum coccineum]